MWKIINSGSRKGAVVLAGFLVIGAILPFSLQSEDRNLDRKTAERIRRGVVQVQITGVDYSHQKPWISSQGNKFTVIGLIVPGNRILLAGLDVFHGAFFEVKKFSSYNPAIATVDRLDMEVNLALLKVEDETFFSDLQPLEPGTDPAAGDFSRAVKLDDLFREYTEKISIMEVEPSEDYGFTMLADLIFRPSEPFPSGGFLLDQNDRLAGYIKYSQKGKKAEAAPVSVLERFYTNAKKRPYEGFVSQGFYTREIIDPVQKEFLGLGDREIGVYITRVLPGTSAWGVLEKGDVLLSIDGVELDNKGYYVHPEIGKQKGQMLLARNGMELRRPGSKVSVRVLRNGKEKKLEMVLQSNQKIAERIPWMVRGQSDFFIESGYVFTELSVPLLREIYGKSWKVRAVQFSYLFETKRFYEKEGLTDRIVVLSEILPDPVNRGMDDLGVGVVSRINGEPVQNLRSFYEKLKKMDGMVQLEMSDGKRIFLDKKESDRASKRIKENYEIPQDVFFAPPN